MKACVFFAIDKLEVTDVPSPDCRDREVLVSLKAAALNHRDVWIKAGQYAGLKFPCVPGSDGAGVVTKAGSPEDNEWIGREVIINPSFGWGDSEAAQGTEFSILGLPREGTLAEYVAVPINQLSPKPAYLSWAEAAALPLAGLTAYRAVFSRARLLARERVLISGVGGGVATFALQYAVAAGAEVFVTSSSDEKIARAVSLGAAGGFNYTRPGWTAEAAKAAGFFNVIVDSAGGEGFDGLLDLAAPGGRIVFFGATRGNPPVLAMRKVFWRQLSLLGTTMGSANDWAEMLAFVERHRIRPVVSEVFAFERAPEAFKLMEEGGQFGKIVLEIAPA